MMITWHWQLIGVDLLCQVYRNPFNYGRLNNWKVFLGVQKRRCVFVMFGVNEFIIKSLQFLCFIFFSAVTGWHAFSFPLDTSHTVMAWHGRLFQLKRIWYLYDTLRYLSSRIRAWRLHAAEQMDSSKPPVPQNCSTAHGPADRTPLGLYLILQTGPDSDQIIHLLVLYITSTDSIGLLKWIFLSKYVFYTSKKYANIWDIIVPRWCYLSVFFTC